MEKPDIEEVKQMMMRHARMQMEYKGGFTGIREMRKHVAWYTTGYPHSARLRNLVNQAESIEEDVYKRQNLNCTSQKKTGSCKMHSC